MICFEKIYLNPSKKKLRMEARQGYDDLETSRKEIFMQ